MRFRDEKSPGGPTGGSSEKVSSPSSTHRADSSIPENLTVERFERELNGCYVVMAQIRSASPEPRYRRKFYVNLNAAQRAVERARADGRAAYLMLATLQVIPAGARRIGLDVNGGDL